jgi:hypothetical protein
MSDFGFSELKSETMIRRGDISHPSNKTTGAVEMALLFVIDYVYRHFA